MQIGPKTRRWGPDQRLEFIEFRLFWEGGVNRSDLIEQFGVSVPQASNDLAAYRKLAPGNIDYDLSNKCYVPSPLFQPRILKPNPDRLLAQVKAIADGILERSDTWLSRVPTADALPIPSRRTAPSVLQALLRAVDQGLSVEIEYQSTSPDNPDPLWRWISPHAFGFDGFRWHVRAFCHREKRFKDFILGRCLAAGDVGAAEAHGEEDWQWQNFFKVILQPNPQLTDGQRRAVAIDYGMTNDNVIVLVRFALLYYFNKRLRLDVAERFDMPRERPVIVANKGEFDEALKKADAPISTVERTVDRDAL